MVINSFPLLVGQAALNKYGHKNLILLKHAYDFNFNRTEHFIEAMAGFIRGGCLAG